MIISVFGECDKRPVVYALLKILQEFGDVLYISNESHALRLSDTRQSLGHYQNIMVAYTEEGFDDFFDDSRYGVSDFDAIVVEGVVCTEADLMIFVEGAVTSAFEESDLSYLDDYKIFRLFKKNLYTTQVIKKVEEFEAYGNLCAMSQGVVNELVPLLSGLSIAPPRSLTRIALRSDAPKRLSKQLV